MQPVRFSYKKQPQQLVKMIASSDHIIKSTNILRINYCQPYRFTAQTKELKQVKEDREEEVKPSLNSSMRESRRSQKMSVVSKELRDNQKLHESSILSAGHNSRDQNNLPFNQTNSVLLDVNEKGEVPQVQSSRVSSQPIVDSVSCNIFNCQDPKQRQQVPELVFKARQSNTSNRSDRKASSKRQSKIMILSKPELQKEPSGNFCAFPENQLSSKTNSIHSQNKSRTKKLINESEQTLDEVEIPQAVANNWRKLLASEAYAENTTIAIAPFVIAERE